MLERRYDMNQPFDRSKHISLQTASASEGPDRSKAVYKLCPQLITRISRSAAFLTGPTCQPVIDWCNLHARNQAYLMQNWSDRLGHALAVVQVSGGISGANETSE